MARVDRLRERQADFTGIDFVRVEDGCDQTVLRVFLLTNPTLLVPSLVAVPLTAGSIVIRPEDPSLPALTVTSVSGPSQDATLPRWYIEVTVREPGGFAPHRLRIEDPRETGGQPSRFDPYFNNVRFSFKVTCDDGLDCAPPPLECPPEPEVDFPVDYLARDFVSFQNALLDFAAQRYPDWSLPIVPDVGVMLAEVLSALGDEFSYIQDRHGREAFLETANQRRSLRKKARLLDYDVHDGLSPSTLVSLDVELASNQSGVVPTGRGSRLVAPSDNTGDIIFEVGLGMHDEVPYPVHGAWNPSALEPYWFDEDEICLPEGATSLYVRGELPDRQALTEGRQRYMLLATEPANTAQPARAHFVRVKSVTVASDPLENQPLTRIEWDERDALPVQIDQEALKLWLNVVPATSGETLSATFSIEEEPGSGNEPAVGRQGSRYEPLAAPSETSLFGLPQTDSLGLGFLGESLRNAWPEIRLVDEDNVTWEYRRTLLGASKDQSVFTLEDGLWRAIRRFWTPEGYVVHRDYASGRGYSLRFGDGEFGRRPTGSFAVEYRSGPGQSANLPAGAIARYEFDAELARPGDPVPPAVTRLSQPFAIIGGMDPESQREIKQSVPQAYQQNVMFALRPEDYGAQAEKLKFVQRAEGTQRWTGSWHSTFVAADPYATAQLTEEQYEQLVGWMDCVRQAGRDVIVRDARTLAIDLEITICIEAFAYPDQVARQVHEVLLGPGSGRRIKGYFHPDHFTFGTPLRRSALEAAIQGVPGVRAVRRMRVRERGTQRLRTFSELELPVAPDQVLRLDNDPLNPGNGTLRLMTEGGA